MVKRECNRHKTMDITSLDIAKAVDALPLEAFPMVYKVLKNYKALVMLEKEAEWWLKTHPYREDHGDDCSACYSGDTEHDKICSLTAKVKDLFS